MIRFAESFRLHAAMAEFLRQEVYRHDGIAYHSKKRDRLPAHPLVDALAAAVLDPDYPLVVVVHDEAESQVRNAFEQALIGAVLRDAAVGGGAGRQAGGGVGRTGAAKRRSVSSGGQPRTASGELMLKSAQKFVDSPKMPADYPDWVSGVTPHTHPDATATRTR